MSENSRGFYLPLKIIIIGLLLIIVFIVLIIYSQGLNYNESNVNKSKVIEKPVLKNTEVNVDYEKLEFEYQEALSKILNNFMGNFEILRDQILDLKVTNNYQRFHLDLIIALDNIIYNQDRELAKEQLQSIIDKNEWIRGPLSNIISDWN